MAIDISHRQRNQSRRTVTIKNTKKQKNGLTFSIISIAAVASAAVGLAASAFSVNLTAVPYMILSFIGQAAVPLSAFLTAQVYNHARNPRKTILALAIMMLVTHIPYVLLSTGKLEIISETSLIFPLLMGTVGLMVSDMPAVDRNVKTILMLLICFTASIGYGGSVAAVWLIIFGSHYDRQAQTKLFYAVGLISAAIDFIYGIMNGHWYNFIPSLGFLIAAPLINNFNPFRTEVSKGLIYVIFYPVFVTGILLIKILTN